MEQEQCSNCKFFREFEKVDLGNLEGCFTEFGICRRYPPVDLVSVYQYNGEVASCVNPSSPFVEKDGWCGEFKK